jgi:hypothetical protein
MQGNAQPAPRPNQQQPQQPMSPGFGSNGTLANLQNLYPNEDFNNPIFGGPAMTTGFGPKPYPMQNQMYPFPQGMQRLDYQQKYPPGTPMPNLQQMQEMFQQQQQAAQQPQSVSGLLQRNGLSGIHNATSLRWLGPSKSNRQHGANVCSGTR